MRLILFDIDGTLVRVRTQVRSALTGAVEQVIGERVTLDGVRFSGRTDPAIFRDVLQSNEIPVAPRELHQVISMYAQRARETITRADVKVLPGAASLVANLSDRPDVSLGLVTGNVEPVALHKLRMVGLAEYFVAGAFGDDHTNRSHLPSLAILRASLTAGAPIQPSQTVVIGDTVNDVASAQHSGSRSVAVSTGTPTRAELAASTPDLLLESLQSPNLTRRLLAL